MKPLFNNPSLFGFLILLLFFPVSLVAQVNQTEERVYIKIEIKGMACPFCAFGMEKELKKVSGVNNVEIELNEGLAYISTPIKQKPTKKRIEKIITDAGFTVGKIEYRNSPFTIKESSNN